MPDDSRSLQTGVLVTWYTSGLASQLVFPDGEKKLAGQSMKCLLCEPAKHKMQSTNQIIDWSDWSAQSTLRPGVCANSFPWKPFSPEISWIKAGRDNNTPRKNGRFLPQFATEDAGFGRKRWTMSVAVSFGIRSIGRMPSKPNRHLISGFVAVLRFRSGCLQVHQTQVSLNLKQEFACLVPCDSWLQRSTTAGRSDKVSRWPEAKSVGSISCSRTNSASPSEMEWLAKTDSASTWKRGQAETRFSNS